LAEAAEVESSKFLSPSLHVVLLLFVNSEPYVNRTSGYMHTSKLLPCTMRKSVLNWHYFIVLVAMCYMISLSLFLLMCFYVLLGERVGATEGVEETGEER